MKTKGLLSVLLCAALILVLLPAAALAATQDIADGATVNLDDAAYTAGDTLNIAAGASVTISGTKAVQIVCGAGVTITLSGATIDVSTTDNACPISFTGSGNKLILASGTTNALTAGKDEPAVRVEDTTELTISGTGSLNAIGGITGAGIGGGKDSDAGTINITGGNITASVTQYSSSVNGAAIGGGAFGGSGGAITISGGTVNVSNKNDGAGIGGGYQGSAGSVTITGGTVTANVDDYCAGIGPGWKGSGGTVNISGGTVNAVSKWGSAIGGAYEGSGISVDITGGTVTASSNNGYDIGSGKDGSGGGTLSVDDAASLTLDNNGTNATVVIGDAYIRDDSTASTITDGYYVDGSLFGDSADEIVIDVGGTYTTTSGFGFDGTTFTLPLSDYTYLLTGSTTERKVAVSSGVTNNVILFGASIQLSSGCALDITGANVSLELCGSSTLKSGSGYAGLKCPSGAAVAISSSAALSDGSNDGVVGSLTAAAGEGATAGIGGAYGSSGAITIEGGEVTATGDGGAGIGGGGSGGSGTVTIKGGTVNAQSSNGGAGIGGGFNGGGTIVIEGGTVNATGNSNGGAGIGGGIGTPNNSVSITISGGVVFASAYTGEAQGYGAGAQDIGDGNSLSGTVCTLSISGTASVFLKNDICPTPTTTTHTHLTDNKSYGFTMPDGWTTFGAWLRVYTVSYNANNGSGTMPDSVTKLYNATETVASGSGLSRTGYQFNGWNTAADGSGIGYAAGSTFTFTADTTLYAQWTAESYTLDYDLDGGAVSSANPTGYTVESDAITLNNPTKTGYTFAGWTGTGITRTSMSVTIPAGSTGNREYTAHWTATAYALTYELGGGTASNPTSYTVENGAITLNNPTRGGYTFAGWTGTGISGTSMSVTIPAGSMGNREYTAHWTATAYTLDYDLDGGAVSSANPTGYTVESDATTLNNPTKTGYTFAGWTGTGITGTSMSVTIPAGSTGDRTYTAHWEAVVISGLPQTYTMYTGGRVTWDPQPEGGTWDWDESFFSATFNSPATFTALKAGTSVISYTADGVTQSVTVTVNESELPQTGQDFTWVWVIAGLAVCSGAAGIVVRKRRISKPLR